MSWGSPKSNIKEVSVPGTPLIGPGVDDPCWQLFCLKHGIGLALAAWSFADRPEMLHAEGSEKHGDEGHRHHRDVGFFGVWSALVTRLIPAKSPELHSEPCVAALGKELGTLRETDDVLFFKYEYRFRVQVIS